MYRIWTKGREVQSTLGSSGAGSPSYSHYFRLFILGGIDLVITVPFNAWYFTTLLYNISPWPGWDSLHNTFSKVAQISVADINDDPKITYQLEITRWIFVVYAFAFFGLFGLSSEAKRHYASSWQYVSRIVCRQTRESSEYVLGLSYSNPFLGKQLVLTNYLGNRRVPTAYA
jgi:Pheromone A receptor